MEPRVSVSIVTIKSTSLPSTKTSNSAPTEICELLSGAMMREARLVYAFRGGISGYLAIKNDYSLAHFLLPQWGFPQQKGDTTLSQPLELEPSPGIQNFRFPVSFETFMPDPGTWQGRVTSRGRNPEAPRKMALPSGPTGGCPERLCALAPKDKGQTGPMQNLATSDQF